VVEPLEGQLGLFGGETRRRPASEDFESIEELAAAPAPAAPLGRGEVELPPARGVLLPPPQRMSGRGPKGRKRAPEPEPALFPPPPPVPQRPQLPFSRRVSDLVRRLQLLERDSKAGFDLTLPQSHALYTLRTAGSLRMQELAESLGLAQSTVTRLVAPLKRVGLLDRRPDRDDGRATRAFLTEKGRQVADAVDDADRSLYQRILDRLPETRRAEVVAAVELLHETVLLLAEEE